jgi:transglutaminase-like putative cysteine protease
MTTRITASQSYPSRAFGNFYFRDGVLLTGLLVTLIYLTAAIALDAAGYVENMVLLIPVTLGAALLGMFIAYSRFDGWFAFSHSILTGLAWIFLLMANLVKEEELESFLNFGFSEFQAKIYYILWRLITWVDAAWNQSINNDNYVFIFEISFLLWALTYFGMWSIFRYGYTWRAVVPVGVVLLISTYYAPQPTVGFLMIFCLLTLLFLVRTNLAEQQLRWRERGLYLGQDVTFDFLRDGLLYSTIVLSLAWLAPGLEQSVQVRNLLLPVNQRFAAASISWNQLYGGLNRQTRTSGGFGRSLTLSGERNVSDSPVFTVAAPVGRYWRAVAFDTFTGRQWLNTLENETNFAAGVPLPAPDWPMRTLVTQTITLSAPVGNVIFGAADIRQISVPVIVLAQLAPVTAIDGVLNGRQEVVQGVEVVYARTDQSLGIGDSYTVVSRFSQVTRQALENAGTDYPQMIVDKYLQLPANFSARVAQSALEITSGAATPYAKAKALETYLRMIKYNDAIQTPPPDVDPVEYFLYDIKEGYCDYYATAMAVMLRSLGIPTRTVSGYATGAYDAEAGAYFVTARDAHTWVEVFFPNLGWIEFEPTASRSPSNFPEGNELSTTVIQSQPVGDENALPVLNQPPPDDSQPPPSSPVSEKLLLADSSVQSWPWREFVILALLLLSLSWLGLYRRRIRRAATFAPELPALLYTRLLRWVERLELSMRTSDTPYEQARFLGRVLPTSRSWIQQVTEGYVHYRFSRPTDLRDSPSTVTVAAAANRDLIQAWQQLQPLLWRAWLRKFLNSWRRRNTNLFKLSDR